MWSLDSPALASDSRSLCAFGNLACSQTPSPNLESIIPRSVVIICTQHFVAPRFALAPLASCADHFAVYALQTRPLFLAFGSPRPTLQRHSFLCDSSDTHRICFSEVRQLHLTFPSSLATIDILSVPSRTPLALHMQPCAFMHTSGTSHATLVLRAQPSLEAKQVSTNAMYPLAGPVGQKSIGTYLC